MENDIIVLKNKDQFPHDSKYSISHTSEIQQLKISENEKIMAVAILNQVEQPSKIFIYDSDHQNQKFQLICTLDNISATIELLDFSVDNQYLLYKDSNDEVVISDLSSQKRINIIYIENDLKWASDGVKIHEHSSGIHHFYSEDNRILKAVKY